MGEFEVCELGRLEEVLDLGRFINKQRDRDDVEILERP